VVAALAATAISTVGMVSLAPVVAADTPGCVTRAEFARIDIGVTKRRVHAIFDTAGRFGDGFAGGYTRAYRSCARPHVLVNVWYEGEHAGHPARVIRKGHIRTPRD
jgi:hypothetical protein